MAESRLRTAWSLATRLEGLLHLQETMKIALEKIEGRLAAIETRIGHLEAGQTQLIAEAKAAAATGAAAAATAISSAALSDLVTRVTRAEDALKRLPSGAKRQA